MSFVSVPAGVIAAFCVARHPNALLGIAVRFGPELLSGVPSSVIGQFGYTLVGGPQGHYSALAGFEIGQILRGGIASGQPLAQIRARILEQPFAERGHPGPADRGMAPAQHGQAPNRSQCGDLRGP